MCPSVHNSLKILNEESEFNNSVDNEIQNNVIIDPISDEDFFAFMDRLVIELQTFTQFNLEQQVVNESNIDPTT